ncbi:putative toxin-antitoxin system toxin component, PIN family [Candidatus Gottesmanbacteria bacterium RIFCSPHIGHO2_12_FULL_43_26]|uniref:Putative toxin-antitoxin system toxin component, PIN family n=1 Tax=Candidatus Gottesmanbacteria bacterium RIFCSPLOWO2_01_FULL_42_22 TaxID=1798391 RepID=A0A1F6BCG8_9BACT|nr:MAG: putative toxin-antitoxin system toxin component, PIN family [Candidatus Gottesmanbacteria bacterium RIFCSPHIGHO2_12_FULL_43_26]OGG34644.1 MAG: putative toxin-antitoxin system toxin component, PIN family [Candidatus Gottesmanbacteria bacterium RIFCSPLOWO2_01_FULL_42_22]
MANDPRVVVDTNVLISGLLGIKNSPSGKILKAMRNQKFILINSPLILKEIGEVINRKRIVKITKMSVEERKSFLEELIERGEVSAGNQLSKIIGRDVKDDKILACAYEAKADYIVTGDEDLLVLKEYEGTMITTPKEFIEILSL